MAKAKINRGPGQAAVDKAADALDKAYRRIIANLQNSSPYDPQVEFSVKQVINEFADDKSKIYGDE